MGKIDEETLSMIEKKAIELTPNKNHRNSPVIGDGGVKTKPGDNSKIAGMLLEIHTWGRVDNADVKALEERFWKFVKFCVDNDMRVTNMMVYYALGIDKTTAYEWSIGKVRTPAHTDFIKKVQMFCASYREFLGANGKLNPITLVWWQKNYDGFVDKVEHVITPNNPLGERTDPKEIQKRLVEGVVDV